MAKCFLKSTETRHLDVTFGLQVVESSSLVSVLFREIPTSSFTSKWFPCYNHNNYHNQILQMGFLGVY